MSLLDKLRAEVLRRWSRGDLLRSTLPKSVLAAASSQLRSVEFPWRIPLLRRSPVDALNLWSQLRGEIEGLIEASDRDLMFTIEWSAQQHRQLGVQRWPAYVRLDSVEQAARLIGQEAALLQFQMLSESLLNARPALSTLIASEPFLFLNTADDWPRLLALLDWFEAHPQPGCYLREVDAPGIDTKFIEARRALIARLLDQALPAARLGASAGASGFEAAFGMRNKPRLIRVRLLDASLAPAAGLTDLSLPIEQLANWPIPCQSVFITENEINGLSFPQHASSMVIFGLGYGLESLAEIPWLQTRTIHYWGDIDTHGFAMLARLRRHLPKASSMLMDEATLLAHRAHWTQEPTQAIVHTLETGLDRTEARLLHALRNQHFGDRVRLEQERIRLHWLRAALDAMS